MRRCWNRNMHQIWYLSIGSLCEVSKVAQNCVIQRGGPKITVWWVEISAKRWQVHDRNLDTVIKFYTFQLTLRWLRVITCGLVIGSVLHNNWITNFLEQRPWEAASRSDSKNLTFNGIWKFLIYSQRPISDPCANSVESSPYTPISFRICFNTNHPSTPELPKWLLTFRLSD
jgi:hypothetical protein